MRREWVGNVAGLAVYMACAFLVALVMFRAMSGG